MVICVFALLVLVLLSLNYTMPGTKGDETASNEYISTDRKPETMGPSTINRGQLNQRNYGIKADDDNNIKEDEDSDVEVTEADADLWLKETVVVIDPGHGGSDYGTYYGSIYEKDIVLDISLMLGELLEKSGINVIYTRKEDDYVKLKDRISMANEANADLFISVHVNSFENDSSVNGTETLYFNTGEYGDGGLDSEKLAMILQEKLVESLSTQDRGIIERPKLAVLRLAEVPAALAELGYLSNASDREKLMSQEYRQKVSESMHDAIIKALRIKYKND